MSERFLSAKVYQDSFSPDLPVERAIAGIEIVKTIAPWIRIERTQRAVTVGGTRRDFIVADTLAWPRLDADLNVVLTNRPLVRDGDVLQTGGLDHKRLATQEETVGLAFHFSRVGSKRIALVNTRSIRRYEHTVAHELGHLLGVKGKNDDQHCGQKTCLMYPLLRPYGRVDRIFCECCSGQLEDNSRALRKAKAGRFVLGNTKIF